MKYYIITLTDKDGFKQFFSRKTLKLAKQKYKWEKYYYANMDKEVTLTEIKERKVKCANY